VNRRAYSTLFLCLVIAALALASCRRGAAGSAISTPTATPYSTPLPAIPTVPPVGSQDNTLHISLHPTGTASAARNAASALQDAFLQAGLYVTVDTVGQDSEALAALCASSGGQVSVAFLDGITYAAATAQSCGLPVLQVQKGTGRTAHSGEVVEIIVNKDANISTVSELSNKKFCRIAADDFYTWLVPTLIMKAGQVDPLTAPKSVTDYSDLDALVAAVVSGDCDAAGIAKTDYDAISTSDTQDKVDVLTESTPIPYNILLIPLEVPLGVRLQLTDALANMAEDTQQARTLKTLLGQDALVRVGTTDFGDLDTFLTSTGLDFAQLGQ
jgi:ABC-type phosphate/phosphonate transport system substrate-binding protein